MDSVLERERKKEGIRRREREEEDRESETEREKRERKEQETRGRFWGSKREEQWRMERIYDTGCFCKYV